MSRFQVGSYEVLSKVLVHLGKHSGVSNHGRHTVFTYSVFSSDRSFDYLLLSGDASSDVQDHHLKDRDAIVFAECARICMAKYLLGERSCLHDTRHSPNSASAVDQVHLTLGGSRPASLSLTNNGYDA